MRAIAEKRAVFKRLHQPGCFVLPNPRGGGSARPRERLVALASARAPARGHDLTMKWRTASHPTFGIETGTGG
jgi:hypothetical protein